MTMRGIQRAIAGVFFALTLLGPLAVAAQSTNKTSVTIHLSVYVPPALKLSLDFASSGVTQIAGYLGSSPGTARAGFELKPNAVYTLGMAHIISNLNSSYSIVVQSMNGGVLKHQSADSEIPYSLLVGSVPAVRYGDAFRVVSSLRTPRDGLALPVSIALGNIPPSASVGVYTDNLLFNIMAN
jgi:hypothetical protein